MDESEGQVVNFERICRLCLHEKRTLTDIFEPTSDNNNYSIDQKIMACATIDLSKGDGLPSRICVKCLTSVNAAFDFRVQCENADKTLHILHDLLNSETDKIKPGKDVSATESTVEEIEETEKVIDKEKENLEHIILIKEEDGETKRGDEGDNDFYYIIKDNDDDYMEGVLSDAEVVYYENGSNSGLSSAESTDGRVAIEEADAEEKEEVEEEKEEEEEEEEEEVRLEEKPNANCEKKYRVLIKTAPEYQSATEAQAKAYKKIGDDTLKSPCPYCNKLLTRVDEHIRLMHRNKVYICTKFNCGAQFTTLKNLQSHQLTCYDVEKAYKCHYCYKEFHRKSNYKAHVRRHNSKKEFQCQLCDSAFVDTTGLRRHFLKHHEPEREVFVSNCCGKRFKSKEGLKKHINRRICGIEVIQVVDPSPIEVPM